MQAETRTAEPVNGRVEPVPAAVPPHVETHFSWLRTRLSTERTLMSWDRTALSLIGFGFTIYQFFQKFQEATVGSVAIAPEAPRNLGLAFILVGTVGTLIALWQYWQFERYLLGDQFKPIGARDGTPRCSLGFVIAVFSALIGLVTTIWIVTRG
jgi:putative membrane protein